ncbi:MAG: RNA-binding ATPase activator esf2 [Stictis urceolatum]|nr:RNA-binding ATPase activator esf2 [Stictis urceolata]
MSRKRNEFLDASDGEEDLVHDSNVEEDTRFRALPSKRRKPNAAEDEASSESEADHDGIDEQRSAPLSNDQSDTLRKKSAADHLASTAKNSSKPVIKPLTPAQLAASQEKVRKTGVIYISRIPPFMKPSALRNLLSPYGTILRIFLTPEPTPAYQKRVRAGGNKKRSFVDGWVEFASKTKAKIVAETLNGNIIGGKKGSWYHDDIWNMKYLRGFKWNDLMEQVQNEERVREGRLRAEISKEAKERKAFMENLEVDKKRRGMETKRKKKRQQEDGEGASGTVENEAAAAGSQRPVRGELRFRQNEVKDRSRDIIAKDQPDDVHRVLSKIF